MKDQEAEREKTNGPTMPKRNINRERMEHAAAMEAWMANGQQGPEPVPPMPDEMPVDPNVMTLADMTALQ